MSVKSERKSISTNISKIMSIRFLI